MKTGYLAERSKQLQLAALSIAQGMQIGSFRSHFRGRGIEFDSLREYEAGDDIRSIDWNLMARSGKTFVKLYREERDLRLFLIADVSASMDAGCTIRSPQEKLLEAAALITFAAEHLHSYTGLLAFDGKVSRVFQLQRGRESSLHILNMLERIAVSDNKSKGTALRPALETAAKLLRQRALVIILSDFKVEHFEKELGLLARRHDVAAIRITAPYDEALPVTDQFASASAESYSPYNRRYPTMGKLLYTLRGISACSAVRRHYGKTLKQILFNRQIRHSAHESVPSVDGYGAMNGILIPQRIFVGDTAQFLFPLSEKEYATLSGSGFTIESPIPFKNIAQNNAMTIIT